jgi:hypothetical protein
MHPQKELTPGQINKKANWTTVSLPRSVVQELRATASNLEMSVAAYVALAHATYTGKPTNEQ